MLSRLQSQAELTSDPALLVRLAAAMARLSDSIVRALAAHHKLDTLARTNELDQERAELENARAEQYEAEEQSRQHRAEWWRRDQEQWLTRLSQAAESAASGDPDPAAEFVANVRALLRDEDYICPPDRTLIAAMREAAANGTAPKGAFVPYPSIIPERDPVVQLR
jgi:hypothetical protein